MFFIYVWLSVSVVPPPACDWSEPINGMKVDPTFDLRIQYLEYTNLKTCKLACEDIPECKSIDYNQNAEKKCQLFKDFGNIANALIPAGASTDHFDVNCPPGK